MDPDKLIAYAEDWKKSFGGGTLAFEPAFHEGANMGWSRISCQIAGVHAVLDAFVAAVVEEESK